MTTQETGTVPVLVAELSTEELQKLLDQRKANETAAKQKQRKIYESKKEELINTLSGFAVSLRDQMLDLKLEAFRDLSQFREEMLKYGGIRGGENNKGSFELKNEDFKIVYKSQVNKKFDERAELAETKLKEFLATMVKKKDRSAYDLIMTLLEKNEKTGDFDFDLINRLYKMKDRFDNPLWREALDMFMESYNPSGTAQYIQFFSKDKSNNSWVPVVLDFAKLRSVTKESANLEKQ